MDELPEDRRGAVVTITLTMLKELFADECTLVRVGITDDDFMRNSINVFVADNPNLPVLNDGMKPMYMGLAIQLDEQGHKKLTFASRSQNQV